MRTRVLLFHAFPLKTLFLGSARCFSSFAGQTMSRQSFSCEPHCEDFLTTFALK